MTGIQVRPMGDETGGTCDWGYCDALTVAERFSPEMQLWLPVCERHGKRKPARPSPGRGICSGCGRKDISLTVAGKIRAHQVAFAVRCDGSGMDPNCCVGEPLHTLDCPVHEATAEALAARLRGEQQ